MSLQMRQKYAADITSAEYVRTGRPVIMRMQLEAAKKDMKLIEKEVKKAEKKAIAEYKRKHKDVDVKKIVFI